MTHVLPKRGDWPLAKIDDAPVQQWATDLGARGHPRLSPPPSASFPGPLHGRSGALTGREPLRRCAPPSNRLRPSPMRTISRSSSASCRDPRYPTSTGPSVPRRRRRAASGERVGLGWDAVDLRARDVYVTRVVVESRAGVNLRNYPESRAGIVEHRPYLRCRGAATSPSALHTLGGPGVSTSPGGALRRSTFRRRVWVPALDRAGLSGPRVPRPAALVRLRLVSDNVPVNIVQRLMGHKRLDDAQPLRRRAEGLRRPGTGAPGRCLLTIC